MLTLCYRNAESIINALLARQILEQASKSPQNPHLPLYIHPFMKSRAEPQHPSFRFWSQSSCMEAAGGEGREWGEKKQAEWRPFF